MSECWHSELTYWRCDDCGLTSAELDALFTALRSHLEGFYFGHATDATDDLEVIMTKVER